MSDELSDKVKFQIEEILGRAEKPVVDVQALVNRVLEILDERFPSFLAAIVLEAFDEQLAKYERSAPCKYFTGSLRCKKGKIIGEACLSCNDYKPKRRK